LCQLHYVSFKSVDDKFLFLRKINEFEHGLDCMSATFVAADLDELGLNRS
jgi:hypothetical protein